MNKYKPARQVDRMAWAPNTLVVTVIDKCVGVQLTADSYFVRTAFFLSKEETASTVKLNLADTEFEVNTFLADMISQPHE